MYLYDIKKISLLIDGVLHKKKGRRKVPAAEKLFNLAMLTAAVIAAVAAAAYGIYVAVTKLIEKKNAKEEDIARMMSAFGAKGGAKS